MALAEALAQRVAQHGGAALIVDYGQVGRGRGSAVEWGALQVGQVKWSFHGAARSRHAALPPPRPRPTHPSPPCPRCGCAVQDAPYEASLQAIKRHEFVGLLEQPGDADLSNRVDYSALR